MRRSVPRVSIGLPVYNGARFIRAALDSLLAQTFQDFELIISDNSSTDQTSAICAAYAAKDCRVRYYRSEVNRGAGWNFNRVFHLSTAPYFKWAAHDDVCEPDFLFRCVEVLDRDATVVLCHPTTVMIDEHGRFVGGRPWNSAAQSTAPPERFCDIILLDHHAQPIFGVIRSAVLRRTRLFRPHPLATRVLLAELALHGRFFEVTEPLMLHREHASRSVYTHPGLGAVALWYDPANAARLVLPRWRFAAECFDAITRASLTWRERLQCYASLWTRARRHWKGPVQDVVRGARQLSDGWRGGPAGGDHW